MNNKERQIIDFLRRKKTGYRRSITEKDALKVVSLYTIKLTAEVGWLRNELRNTLALLAELQSKLKDE